MPIAMKPFLPEGIAAALAAALLFGASPALAKLLLERIDPWLLAALLYLGCGSGLWLYRRLRRAAPVRLEAAERVWLAGAVLCGGVVGPVLLLFGLSRMAASGAALLLNAEGVFTALVAWALFREHIGRRIALGMAAIAAGGALLAWSGDPMQAESLPAAGLWPALAILGACLAWAIDNNLTRKVALADATWLAMVKGLVAGSVNLVLALAIGSRWPTAGAIVLGALLGFVSYGASLVLFVVALRQLGAARCGAYFSVAPFFAAALAVLLLGEPVTWQLIVCAMLMGVGVALHVTERHAHRHAHEPVEHSHAHTHGADDGHHDHSHAHDVPAGTLHTHWHRHEPLMHTHAHYPDAHHRHAHDT